MRASSREIKETKARLVNQAEVILGSLVTRVKLVRQACQVYQVSRVLPDFRDLLVLLEKDSRVLREMEDFLVLLDHQEMEVLERDYQVHQDFLV